MTELIVYSKQKHLQCEELKDALNEVGVHYHEVDIRNPEAITELRKNGCFALEPPVLQVVHASRSPRLFKNDDLFWDGQLIREAVMDVMQVSRPQTS
jgi:glutaredoxin